MSRAAVEVFRRFFGTSVSLMFSVRYCVRVFVSVTNLFVAGLRAAVEVHTARSEGAGPRCTRHSGARLAVPTHDSGEYRALRGIGNRGVSCKQYAFRNWYLCVGKRVGPLVLNLDVVNAFLRLQVYTGMCEERGTKERIAHCHSYL